jgi:hypothetical protein
VSEGGAQGQHWRGVNITCGVHHLWAWHKEEKVSAYALPGIGTMRCPGCGEIQSATGTSHSCDCESEQLTAHPTAPATVAMDTTTHAIPTSTSLHPSSLLMVPTFPPSPACDLLRKASTSGVQPHGPIMPIRAEKGLRHNSCARQSNWGSQSGAATHITAADNPSPSSMAFNPTLSQPTANHDDAIPVTPSPWTITDNATHTLVSARTHSCKA